MSKLLKLPVLSLKNASVYLSWNAEGNVYFWASFADYCFVSFRSFSDTGETSVKIVTPKLEFDLFACPQKELDDDTF